MEYDNETPSEHPAACQADAYFIFGPWTTHTCTRTRRNRAQSQYIFRSEDCESDPDKSRPGFLGLADRRMILPALAHWSY